MSVGPWRVMQPWRENGIWVCSIERVNKNLERGIEFGERFYGETPNEARLKAKALIAQVEL